MSANPGQPIQCQSVGGWLGRSKRFLDGLLGLNSQLKRWQAGLRPQPGISLLPPPPNSVLWGCWSSQHFINRSGCGCFLLATMCNLQAHTSPNVLGNDFSLI